MLADGSEEDEEDDQEEAGGVELGLCGLEGEAGDESTVGKRKGSSSDAPASPKAKKARVGKQGVTGTKAATRRSSRK